MTHGTRSPTGRPRSLPGPHASDPREGIIGAATGLFATKGYARTTMKDIATAAGLQQSSLYYWFNRKELILQAAFGVNRAPLAFVTRMAAEPGTPPLRLYRLVRFDIRQLCSAPVDVNEVERMAEAEPDVFSSFWDDRQKLHDWLSQLVANGIDSGDFIESDSILTALNLLSADEGVPNWVRNQQRHRLRSSAGFRHARYTVDQAAEHFAGLAVRGLLARPSRTAKITAEASNFDDRPPAPARSLPTP